jgi:hypothetical protein
MASNCEWRTRHGREMPVTAIYKISRNGCMALAAFAASAPKFLYVTDLSGNVVVGFLVNPTTGTLTSNGQSAVATGAFPQKAASDQGGFRLYVSNTNAFNKGSNSDQKTDEKRTEQTLDCCGHGCGAPYLRLTGSRSFDGRLIATVVSSPATG